MDVPPGSARTSLETAEGTEGCKEGSEVDQVSTAWETEGGGGAASGKQEQSPVVPSGIFEVMAGESLVHNCRLATPRQVMPC